MLVALAKKAEYARRALIAAAGFSVVALPAHIHRVVASRDIILLAEQAGEARDNAWHLYNYLLRTDAPERILFVTRRGSPDEIRIQPQHRVRSGSLRHFFYYSACRVSASTHFHGSNPAGFLGRYFLPFLPAKVTVMLSHGIKKDHYSIYERAIRGLDLFVCGTRREHDYYARFLRPNSILRQTGLARFDALTTTAIASVVRPEGHYVLFMPTFRKYLFDLNRLPSEIARREILRSGFFNALASLLNDQALTDELASAGLQLKFYIHRSAQFMLPLFREAAPRAVILGPEDGDVQSLLIGCSALVTDFSSVFFDAAYMGKPVVYYHFDELDYRANHYSEGYFSYAADGFGPVASNIEQVRHALGQLIDSGFVPEKVYESRASNFFDRRDSENCARIMDEIRALALRKRSACSGPSPPNVHAVSNCP